MLEQISGPLQASFTKILALFAVAWLGWFVVSTLIAYNKLRHIPGPPLTGFTNWWWIKAAISGKGHLALKYACDRYGMKFS
jgi:hypothetical protein